MSNPGSPAESTGASLPAGMIDVRRVVATPNQPWYCPAGTFAGRYLLAELTEEQGAVMGRKYSTENAPSDANEPHRKDGRPINPHPVVRVRLFTCEQDGSCREEVDPDEIEQASITMICNATLYPWNYEHDFGLIEYPPGTQIQQSSILSGRFHDHMATENTYPPPGMLKQPRRPLGPEQTAAFGELTHGARDVQHVIVPEMGGPPGKKAVFFVFKDLMVAEVGHFVLKYRLLFLDHTLLALRIPSPNLATCWGGVFAMFPSKKAPNLKRSTDLELHLHRNGGHISHPRNVSPDSRRLPSYRGKGKAKGKAGPGRVVAPAPLAIPSSSRDHGMDSGDSGDEIDMDVDEERGRRAARLSSSFGSSPQFYRQPAPMRSTSSPILQYPTPMHPMYARSPAPGPTSPTATVGSSHGSTAAMSPPPSSPSVAASSPSPLSPSALWGSPTFSSISAQPQPQQHPQKRGRYDPVRNIWT